MSDTLIDKLNRLISEQDQILRGLIASGDYSQAATKRAFINGLLVALHMIKTVKKED